MSWNVFKKLLSVKCQDAGTHLTEQLANYDPEAMSEVGMQLLEEELDVLTSERANAELDYKTEHSQYLAIKIKYEQYGLAATDLEEQLQKAIVLDDGSSSNIETSLINLITKMENLTVDLEREHQESIDAKEVFDEFDLATSEMAKQMLNARSEFEKAQRDLKKAEVQQTRADNAVTRNARLAGIRKGGDKIGSAMDAMKNAASKAQAKADATKHKAELLSKTTTSDSDDSLLTAALNKAAGDSKPTLTTSERLKALRNKT